MSDENNSPEDVTGLKAKNSELLGKIKSLQEKNEALTSELENYKGEINKFKEEQEKINLEKLQAEGKIEEVFKIEKEKERQAWLKEKEELTGRLQSLESNLHKKVLENELDSTLVEFGGDPLFLKPVLLNKLELDSSGSIVVKDDNGVRTTKTLKELVKEYAENERYANVFSGSKANGTGTGNGSKPLGATSDASNPFSDTGWNKTKQFAIFKSNPVEAERYARAAAATNKFQKVRLSDFGFK